MWKVNLTQQNGIANVTATFDDTSTGGKTVFSWNETMKVGDTDAFVQRAKDQLVKYKEIHKDDATLTITLEQALNA